MKDSLIVSKKACGLRSYRTAKRLFQVGKKQLDLGYKREAK